MSFYTSYPKVNMDRVNIVEKVYMSGWVLDMGIQDYKRRVNFHLENKFKNDIGRGDVTTNSIVKPETPAKALIKSKEEGIISGIEEVLGFYKAHGLDVIPYVKDGEVVCEKQDIWFCRNPIKNH